MTPEDNEDKLLRSVALQNAESIRIARQRAEEQTEATVSEQAFLLNLTHDAIFVRDIHGTIKYWNRAAQELYGWRAEETIGKISYDVLKTIYPAPIEEIEAEMMRTGRWEGELIRTQKDGTRIVVASRWSLQPYKQDTPIAILETNNDITRRKRAEEEREKLRQLQADLAHINRVTTMGELAASIAHEIKQPIAAAHTNAQACLLWLERDKPDIEEAREAVSRIIGDVTRASEIINRVRSLFQKGESQRELVDVNEVVREMIVLLRNEAERHSISIQTELAPDLPQVKADRVQLQQVLMNLVLNAIDAMNEAKVAGELTIKSQRNPDDQVLVSVSDTGTGLPPEWGDKVFDAFFTTKPQGTGMGLSISRSIIESHGGRLWAAGNPDRGATFQFTLPGEYAMAA